MESKITLETEYSTTEDLLRCPRCGDEHLHHGNPIVFNRVAEDQGGVVVQVQEDGARAKEASESDFPYGRRGAIEIPFECEACGPGLRLLIVQHKGHTLLSWKDK